MLSMLLKAARVTIPKTDIMHIIQKYNITQEYKKKSEEKKILHLKE